MKRVLVLVLNCQLPYTKGGDSYTQIVNVGTLCTAIVGTTDNFATEDNGVARTLNGDIVKRESWKREGKYACKITFIAPSESVVVTWD